MRFVKPKRHTTHVKLLISGPSGAGKTTTALRLATGFGERIGLIDLNGGQAGDEHDLFEFGHLVLGPDQVHPLDLIQASKAADAQDIKTLIIDSITPVWERILHEKDKAANSFQAWTKLKPPYFELMNYLLAWPGHVIVTAKSKPKFEQVLVAGKMRVQSIGIEPIWAPGTEYDWPLWLAVTRDQAEKKATTHGSHAKSPKNIYSELANRSWEDPSEELGALMAQAAFGRSAAYAEEQEGPRDAE